MEDRTGTPLSPSAPDAPNQAGRPHRRRRRHGFAAGIVLGAIGAGLVGFAVGATTPAAEAAFGLMSRRAHGHGGPPAPEQMKEHAEFFVDFALHRLDASPGQKDQVQGIVGGAIDELVPVVEQHRRNRDELRGLLTAATIDRAAIESLRAQEVALADTLSRTVAEALADSAEVLTPSQRADLAERLARFHDRE